MGLTKSRGGGPGSINTIGFDEKGKGIILKNENIKNMQYEYTDRSTEKYVCMIIER